MEPRTHPQPAEIYRTRRRRRIHVRLRPKRLVLGLLAAVLVLPMGWILYTHYPYTSGRSSRGASSRAADRQQMIASINKIMKQAGKDIPASDLVVGSATVYHRGGNRYLSGTVHNQSSRIYPRVHVVFDTFDSSRNPAGTVEADLNDLKPGKEGAFEIGPLNPAVVSFMVRWIQPAQ